MGNKCAPCLGKSHAYDHDKIQSKLENLEESFDQVGEGDHYGDQMNRPMIKSSTIRSITQNKLKTTNSSE